jgi:hypothetical protein
MKFDHLYGEFWILILQFVQMNLECSLISESFGWNCIYLNLEVVLRDFWSLTILDFYDRNKENLNQQFYSTQFSFCLVPYLQKVDITIYCYDSTNGFHLNFVWIIEICSYKCQR